MARIAVILLAAFALRAQSVTIAFTNSVTHVPVANLTINVKGPASFTATSGDAGILYFPPCPPGDYTMQLSGQTYMSPEAFRKPVHVGEAPVSLSFELTPLGRIQGRVLLPDGHPAAGAKVTLLMYRFVQSNTMKTDADGRFSIVSPARGRYMLIAEAPAAAKAPDGEGWTQTYYPDATDGRDAQPIAMPYGADLSGYEIRLRSVPVRRVSGVVLDDAGQPVPGATVRLTYDDQKTTTREDGSFTFPAIRTGEWGIEVGVARDHIVLYAVERLIVGRRDIDDVKLRLVRPFRLPVSITWEGPPDPKGDPPATVSLVPEPPRYGGPSGNREIPNVYPGRYTVKPIGYRLGYYVASVKLGDRDVLGQKVEIVGGAQPLYVVYKPGAATIHAHVENGVGAYVVAIPQDPGLLMDVFIRMGTADADGRCDLLSLRPGDYYVFAFTEGFENTALRDATFISGLIPRAEKVHLDENGSASVSLKVTPWPE